VWWRKLRCTANLKEPSWHTSLAIEQIEQASRRFFRVDVVDGVVLSFPTASMS
jgi:hypothetical protein